MNRKATFFISAIMILALGFACGILVSAYYCRRGPVVGFLRAVSPYPPSPEFPPRDPKYTTLDPLYAQTDVEALISIRAPEDAERLRASLVKFLWGKELLPDGMPTDVERDCRDPRYGGMGGALERIDRVTVEMDFGLKSHVYHFIPKRGNGKLVILHEGHREDDVLNGASVERWLERGYSVAGFFMPLLGPNNQPTVYVDGNGYMKLAIHEQMQFLAPTEGHPIRYFIHPVVVFLNYVGAHYRYGHVAMVGLSGGGWTTTLAAAADPRIRSSFPVAGSLPIFLRDGASAESVGEWGDWEQHAPELYDTVNYLELYILGGCGAGRRQWQILNQYDGCCFVGIKANTYGGIVNRRVTALGAGTWSLFLDSSHNEHKISDVAWEKIFSELDSTPSEDNP